MKALITTQVYENYAWREDGTMGTGPDSWWKPKGGDEYVVLNVDQDEVFEILEKVCLQIERNDDYIQENIIDLRIVEDDYLTEFERDQLEYDGKIEFPAKVIEWAR